MEKNCLLALVQNCHKPTCMITIFLLKQKKKCAGNSTCDVFSLHLRFFWDDIETVRA
jgi:hypothetical protein